MLDASRVLAGPFCGQLLGDLGADVVKIERPGQGDETRTWGPPFAGPFSAYYLSCNRNKRSLALDLSAEQGRELFYRLVRKSDVLLENFRPESAVKLGLSADQLHAVNPTLIICSISGFGRSGPMSELPGYDFAIQALSGLMSITGPPPGPPYKVGVAVTDVLTGLYAATGVLACLQARRQSGHGYHIDLALLDCALASQVNVVQAFLSTGEVPPRQGNAHLQIVPYQAFQTADDWLVLAIGNDGQWQRFCRAAEREDLGNDARFTTNVSRVQHREELIPQLEAIFRTRTGEDWQQLLKASDVPCAPVWDYGQLFAQEQASARNLKLTVRSPSGQAVNLVGSPFHIDGQPIPAPACPPELGQHTDQLLRELAALDNDQIATLREQGIIA